MSDLNEYSLIRFVKSIGQSNTVLIEIQASIQSEIETKFSYMHLGKLQQKNEDTYELFIGNHVITGKLIKLKNPYLLCKKCNEKEKEIKILQLIESKILFDKRPTPLLMRRKKEENKK